jgi:cytochrome c553
MRGSRQGTVLTVLTLFLVAGAGCGGGGGGAGKVPISAQDRLDAGTLFNNRCATCHGIAGTGTGPGAAGLNPKPRDYTDSQWQKTVTDEEIEKAIVYGGTAVGKSAQMAANPDLQAKPGVVAALREKVRQFGQN